MAVTLLANNDPRQPGGRPDPRNDFVNRTQLEHAARVDVKDVFKTESIDIETGAKVDGKRVREPLMLRFALDSTYLFAVFGDNPAWQSRDRDEWDAGARNAIEKFCAIRNVHIKFGPRPEDGNRYNWMAELAQVIEYAESTVALMQQNAEAARRAREENDRALGR